MSTEGTPPAPVGGLRDRVSERMFRSQVRDGLATELKKKAGKGAKFGAAAVPSIVAAVPDSEIDAARAQAEAGAATAVGGPILDWLKDPANRAIVRKVIELLLASLLA